MYTMGKKTAELEAVVRCLRKRQRDDFVKLCCIFVVIGLEKCRCHHDKMNVASGFEAKGGHLAKKIWC